MLLIYLCKSSYFVNMHLLFFCQKYMFLSNLLHTILLFSVLFNLLHAILLFSVLFNEIFIKSIYLLSTYQNLCEFARRTLFLNFNVRHMTTGVFFTSFIFPLKLFVWHSLLIFWSVSAKFGASYITGQWDEFRIK